MLNPFFNNRNSRLPSSFWSDISYLLDQLSGSLVNSSSSLYFNASMKETPEQYIVTVELSGFYEKDVCIELNGNYLTVNAERKTQNSMYSTPYSMWAASSQCRYSRSFHVKDVLADRIRSKYGNGILVLVLPKSISSLHGDRQVNIRQK